MKSDITSLLHLNDWAGRAVLFIYGLGTTVVALLNLQNHLVPAMDLVAIGLLWVPLVTLARRDREPFSVKATAVVVSAVVVISALDSWNVLDTENPGYATWYRGAMTFILLVLCLRGRRGAAWFGFSLFGVISIIGGVFTDLDDYAAIYDVLRQAGTLLIGTLFAAALRRSSQTITAIQNSQLARATVAAATAAAAREGAIQTQRLERGARPALERILAGTPLSKDDLKDFTLLEATLRDGIRATGLSSDRIAQAARDARARNVRVILLDDRGADIDPDDLIRVEEALLAQFAATTSGAITARLSPEDRDEIATILVEENEQYRRVVITETTTDVTQF
jgi:hypothetical protein